MKWKALLWGSSLLATQDGVGSRGMWSGVRRYNDTMTLIQTGENVMKNHKVRMYDASSRWIGE